MKTNDFIKGMIIAYMDSGLSSRVTAQKIKEILTKHQKENQMIDEAFQSQFNVSHTSCLKIFEQFTTTLSYQDRRIENGGQNKIYNEEEKEMICEQVLDNVCLQISEIINNKEINPKSACKSTIKNILNENDIYPYKQSSIIHLTESQKESRIAFCQQHKRWTHKWLQVIFTDESQVQITTYNKYFYLKKGDQIPKDLQKDNNSFPMKVHVWGAICYNGPLFLKRINGNLNAQGYIQILKEFFDEKGDILPENFQFQQDNSQNVGESQPQSSAKISSTLGNKDVEILYNNKEIKLNSEYFKYVFKF
ncbi:hypothetical protein ABPG72_019807 [Tetrahymena utriculariae]